MRESANRARRGANKNNVVSYQMRCPCLIVWASLVCCCEVRGSSRQLHYALFTSGPGSAFDSSGSIPAVELAEEEILKQPALLKGYALNHVQIAETMCDRTRSLNLFFETVAEADPPVLGLVGGGCSVASEPIAEIIHHWNISQVAYSSSATVLSDRRRFLNFFRTSPSEVTFAPAMAALLQHYGWNRIMVITQNQSIFTRTWDNLYPVLITRNITVSNRVVPTSIPKLQSSIVDTDFFLPEEDVRVIFINTQSDVARVILCKAMMTHNLVGFPRYVWITYAWYQDQWWTSAVNIEPTRCEDREIVQLLTLSLTIEAMPTRDNIHAENDVALTTNEFNEEYLRRLDTPAARENNSTFTFVAPIAYDAVWSLALALNKTDAMLAWPKERVIRETNCQDDGIDLSGFRLDNFTYDHTFVGCVVRWNLARTNFIGVSGRVSFDDNGDRLLPHTTVVSYRGTGITELTKMKFGRVNNANFTFEYINNHNNDSIFPGGIPSDGTPVEVILAYKLPLVIVYDFLAFLGFIFTTVCLIFNYAYRNRKIVRLTSPNLNYFIIIGAFVMNASVFIRLIPSTDESVNYLRCNLQVIMNTIAYCLAFGTLLVKMGRIYHIFNNPTEKRKKALKDWHMVAIVLCITGAGVLIPVIGWAVPSLRAYPTLEPNEEIRFGRNDQGIRIAYVVWQCTARNYSNKVNIVLYIYLGLVQLTAIILATQTRKVTSVKALNDYKYIVALVYICSAGLTITGGVTLALGALINVNETVFSGSLILATTLFLSLTFIPKMVSLYRDPLGERIFTDQDTPTKMKFNDCEAVDTTNRLLELEARIQLLEEIIKNTSRSKVAWTD